MLGLILHGLGRARGAATYPGLATTPSYIASGSFVALSTATNPAYGTNAAGDLFVLQVYIRHAGSYTAPTAPSGWTQQSGPNNLGNNAQYFYTRDTRSTGSEAGIVTIPSIVAGGGIAAIHTFRNVATSSFIESITTGGNGSNSATIDAPSVTAGGNHRLAVALVGRGDDTGSRVSFTGEIGGDWTEVYDQVTTTGVDSAVQVQTAALDSGGTISGGNQSDGLSEIYCTCGFALVGV